MGGDVRTAEWISMTFFALFLLGATVTIEDRGRRWRAIAIGAAGVVLSVSLSLLGTSTPARVTRDLVPGLFLLMAYWQSGQFFRDSDPRLQAWLGDLDARWFPGLRRITSTLHQRPLLSSYLELSYLMCYPVVPLAIGALYLIDRPDASDAFWTVVLPPTYACYALIVFFQSLPPRAVEPGGGVSTSGSRLRAANVWLLDRASIRANTLPSGHVANSFAIALALTPLSLGMGLAFMAIAFGITVSTVVLRYHYGVDAVLGVVFALVSFAVFGS